MEKYKWTKDEAETFTSFLVPMLDYNPSARATAQQCLQHPWVQTDQLHKHYTLLLSNHAVLNHCLRLLPTVIFAHDFQTNYIRKVYLYAP